MKKWWVTILVLVGLAAAIPLVMAQEDQGVLENNWALGIDNLTGCPGDINEGWQIPVVEINGETAQVSLARCPKNPAPPNGESDGGAAFKNGPKEKFGLGLPDVEVSAIQEFNLQNRGVPLSDSYTVNLSLHGVCVRCDYARFELYGYDGDWVHLTRLYEFNEDTPPDGELGGSGYSFYQGQSVLVPHYEQYRFQVDSLWGAGSIGVKWTGLKLIFEPAGPVATDTPTPTATPNSPLPTPTSTPEAYQLFRPDGVNVVCNDGNLRILEPVGNSVEIRCE